MSVVKTKPRKTVLGTKKKIKASPKNRNSVKKDKDFVSSEIELEDDFVIDVSPIKEYSVKAKVISIKKAVPNVFLDEEIELL